MRRQKTRREFEQSATGVQAALAADGRSRSSAQRMIRLVASLLIAILLLSSLGGLWAAASTSTRARELVGEHSDWWDNPPRGSANILLPNGNPVTLPKESMAYALEQFLDSHERPPAAFQIDQLRFASGSARPRLHTPNALDDLAAVLVAYPRARVKIVGYSAAEKPLEGQDLAGQRARAIKDALVKLGVKEMRMTAESGGDPAIVDQTSSPHDRFDDGAGQLIVMDN